MLSHVKMLFGLVGSIVVLGAIVGIASANRLSTSSRNIRATWAFLHNEAGGGTAPGCPVTLEGSLHSATIAKVIEALVGFISRATVNSNGCGAGSATLLQESLPWHVRYKGFAGALPNITSINTAIIGWSWRYQEGGFGITCLARSTATEPLLLTLNRNVTTRALTSADVGGQINANCGGEALFPLRFSGRSSSLTLLGATTAITVTLI